MQLHLYTTTNHVNCVNEEDGKLVWTISLFEVASLRARLAECEAVMEQAILAIRNGGDKHMYADEQEAMEMYEVYKSSHEVKK